MDEKTTFNELSESWRKDKSNFVKRSTMSVYNLALEKHLIGAFSSKTDIREEDVQKFMIDKLEEGLSQKSVKDLLVVLKMVVRYGVKHGSFSKPDWDIRFPTMRDNRQLPVLSLKNQRKLMKYIDDNPTPRNLGILLSLHTGMRIGEVCALTWGDIDMGLGLVRVTKTLERIYVADKKDPHSELIMSSPKTSSSNREIPITHGLLETARKVRNGTGSSCYVLSCSRSPIEPRTYRNYYNKVLKLAGVPHIKFHGLRHSFATRCIESRCDYKTVSVILGHSNISTTLNLYVHPDITQKKRCLDTMLKAVNNKQR